MSGADVQFKEWEIKVLVAWCWIDLATYTSVLGFSLHNSVKFLVIQGRWKKFYLTGFYVLTVLLTVSRVLFFFSWLKMLSVEEGDPTWIRGSIIF